MKVSLTRHRGAMPSSCGNIVIENSNIDSSVDFSPESSVRVLFFSLKN